MGRLPSEAVALEQRGGGAPIRSATLRGYCGASRFDRCADRAARASGGWLWIERQHAAGSHHLRPWIANEPAALATERGALAAGIRAPRAALEADRDTSGRPGK